MLNASSAPSVYGSRLKDFGIIGCVYIYIHIYWGCLGIMEKWRLLYGSHRVQEPVVLYALSPIDDSFGLSACERDFAAILSSMEGKLCDICSRPGTSKQCPGNRCLVFYMGILYSNYPR